MRLTDHSLAALAAANSGIVTRSLLRSIGADPRNYRRRIDDGRILQLHEGVGVPVGTIITDSVRIAGALAALGNVGIVSHLSAGHLWGIDCPNDPVDITVPGRPGYRRLEGVRLHRPRDHVDLRSVTRSGFPCTGPLRTLADIGAPPFGDPELTLRTLEHFLVRGVVSIKSARAVVNRHERRGRGGIPALRDAVDELASLDRPTDSVMEAEMLRLLSSAGLPTPRFQHRVGRYQLDFAYPDVKLDIECDGWSTHHSRKQFTEDRERDAFMVSIGWAVQRYTWSQVKLRPAYVAARVASALAVRHGT